MSLKVLNFSKKSDRRWILRDVSFEANEGEIFGIIGERAESFTLLRLICGAEKPDSGKIFFGSEDFTNLYGKKRQFNLLPDSRLSLWKKIFTPTESEKTSVFGNSDFMFEKLAREDSKVLLLDNPFSAFDLERRDLVFEKLRRMVKEKQLVVVLASNNPEEIFALCDQAAVLRKGEIVQTASPRELYEKPNSILSARALGRINLVPAMRVSFNNQKAREFQTLAGEHRLRTDKTDKKLLGAITAPATLAIRPEHISISFGASFPEDNLLKAKIAGVRYQGATTRVFLDANGLMLEALVLRLVGLNVGDECLVGLPPDRILVLKD